MKHREVLLTAKKTGCSTFPCSGLISLLLRVLVRPGHAGPACFFAGAFQYVQAISFFDVTLKRLTISRPFTQVDVFFVDE